MKISKKLIFIASFLVSASYVLVQAYASRPIESKIQALTKDVFVTEQLNYSNFARLKGDGYATVIDIRPDGEAADQLSSSTAAQAASESHLKFVYIPVPREVIPAESVAALGVAIANSPKPIVLYCRIGRRAVRTFSLVEASRFDGPDASTILSMVQSTGFSADDLTNEINRRISNRQNPGGVH
jgi:uncharacterized protein (TIGR01244 family)